MTPSQLPPLEITIPDNWTGKKLQSFLVNGLNLSRRQIQVLKHSSGIRLNGNPVFSSQLLTSGDRLVLTLQTKSQNFLPAAIPLTICYEDPDLIIINKPAGMVVHPVKQHQTATLANALTYYWQTNQIIASFHPVHRLDRFTSGLIVIAKNPWVHQQLDRQINQGHLHRLYLALCHGEILTDSGKITAAILDQPETAKREITTAGKPAITRFRVLYRNTAATLLAIKLVTGRTHQIRVHFADLGHPLWGDPLYGQKDQEFNRPALHAIRLKLIHPRSGKWIRLEAELPEDMRKLLELKY